MILIGDVFENGPCRSHSGVGPGRMEGEEDESPQLKCGAPANGPRRLHC